MKKYFLIICIAFIPVSIQAQWSLGGKAGINWSTINYPWSKLGDHADYLSGFQGGIIATYQFNNYFDMQAELFYSARGYTDDEFYLTDESGAVISNTYTCRTHYLDIPPYTMLESECSGYRMSCCPDRRQYVRPLLSESFRCNRESGLCSPAF